MGEETFGPYRLRSLLGRGGMGEVWLAHHTGLDREVALKRIAGPASQDPDLRARFRREARLAARLTSVHVVPIHEFGEIDGRLYLDMRHIDGPDLRTLLDGHPDGLPASAVHDVVVQLAEALDEAHEHGLVHRDVKPSNVLVDPARGRWWCYLTDFGIAVPTGGAHTRITVGEATIGTPAYMAPELTSPGGMPSVASDVYALGCLLHELLTGRVPFPGLTTASVLYQHAHDDPPVPSAHRPALAGFDAVVVTALAKDPGRRFSSAGELARSLPRPDDDRGRATVVGPPSLPLHASAPARRHPSALVRAFGVAFGLALLAVLGVAIAGYFADPGPPASGTAASVSPAPGTPTGTTAVPTAVAAERLPLPFDIAYGVAVSGDGRTLYVLGTDAAQDPPTALSVVDTGSREVLRRIAVDERAYGLVVAPDGSRAYLTLPGSARDPGDAVQVVDLAAGRALTSVPVGPNPLYPALSPDGARLYVSVGDQDDGSVVAVDTATTRIVGSTPLGPVPGQKAVSPDGRTLYVPNFGSRDRPGSTVSVVDTATMRRVRTLPTRAEPINVALSPDGRTLFVGTLSNGPGSTLDIVDTATSRTTRVAPAGLSVTREFAMSPDGGRLLVPSAGSDDVPVRTVTVLAPSGRPVGPPATLDGRPQLAATTPDGHHAYVTTSQPGGLWYLSFP